jgi:hypothetical protein
MVYTPELAAAILHRIIEGESLRAICKDRDMPNRSSVADWWDAVPGFRAQYDRAMELRADGLAEEALEEALTAEDPLTGRLRYDARKWFAGKLSSKYNDKAEVRLSGELSLTSGIADRLGAARQRLAAVEAPRLTPPPEG